MNKSQRTPCRVCKQLVTDAQLTNSIGELTETCSDCHELSSDARAIVFQLSQLSMWVRNLSETLASIDNSMPQERN